ncbi:MAG: HNH endonuclease, partial [Deltaproteobacteria bacterium]|nr:HNH endonuclease [Deltaproteobacteria bacterium]
MAASSRTEKILWGKAGATCSFPSCRRKLVADATGLDGAVVLGEIAHIVAQSQDGPRGEYPPPGGDIDSYENLLLLCEEHHELIDGQPRTYSVAKLLQMKEDHERWVIERLSKDERFEQAHKPAQLVTETVYSTLLPVSQMPRYVYMAPCGLSENEVGARIVYPRNREIMLPFIVRGGNLVAFRDLSEEHGPFYQAIDVRAAKRHDAQDWWEDPDLYRWYVTLLNRALNKLTGRKGLNLDREHSRYYFEPAEGGQPRLVPYRSLSGSKTSRQVVWRPKLRHSGELKNYWEHLAVGSRFHRVTQTGWCLSIRPERRFTRDGYVPLTPKGIGRRSTSRKSRMYNINVLKEVNFWRDYLSDGSPRIIFKFGSQNLVVQTEMM